LGFWKVWFGDSKDVEVSEDTAEGIDSTNVGEAEEIGGGGVETGLTREHAVAGHHSAEGGVL
jgi:hypothetical protein